MVLHDSLSTLSTELRERRAHAAHMAAALARAETALDDLHREQRKIEQRHQRVQTVAATRLAKAHLDGAEPKHDGLADDSISIELQHAVHGRMEAARQAVEIVRAQLRDAHDQVAQTDMQITAEIERMVTEHQAQALADQREARRRYIEASDILAQWQPDGLNTPANIKVRISPEVEHALAETRHFVNDLDSTVPALRGAVRRRDRGQELRAELHARAHS